MTYAYKCPRCGFEEELDVPMAHRNSQQCRDCGTFYHRRYVFNTVIPVHMRASYDQTLNDILPDDPKGIQEWKDRAKQKGMRVFPSN
jgi:hypothetical protein